MWVVSIKDGDVVLTDLGKLKGIDFSKKFVTTDDIKPNDLKSLENDYYNSLFLDLPNIINVDSKIDEVNDLNYKLLYFSLLNELNGDFEGAHIDYDVHRLQDRIQFKNNVIDVAMYNNHLKYANEKDKLSNEVTPERIESFCKNEDKKDILRKYNLKVSGNTEELVNRLMENLTEEQLNYEFPIDKSNFKFIITEKGTEFINDNIMFRYINYLPFNFTFEEYQLLCTQNQQFTPEEILFCLCYQNWLKMGKSTIRSKDKLKKIDNFNAGYKIELVQVFYNNPEFIIPLYEKIISEGYGDNTEEYELELQEYKENIDYEEPIDYSKPKTIEEEITQKERFASKLMDNGDLDAAITLLEENFATDIYSEFTYYLLWRCYSQKYGGEKSIETLERMVSKCEKNKFNRLNYWKRELKFQKKNLDRKHFELKYAKDMELATNNVAIGDKLCDEGKFEEAIEYYENALEMGLFDFDSCGLLREYYHFKKDFEKERDVCKLIVKNLRNSPFKEYLPSFKDDLANVESFLNNGEWLYDCLPFDVFNHNEIVEKLYEAKKLLKTDNRNKGIDLLEDLIAKGTYVNEVYYALYLAYNKDKKYDDSVRICEKAIEVLGFFSSERLLAWVKHRNKVINKTEKKKLANDIIDINDLKGIDLTNIYYDPSKPFIMENDFFKFYAEPEGVYGGIKYEFSSEEHYSKGVSSNISAYNVLFNELDAMRINLFKIDLLNDLFINYENINFINLFFDLVKINEEFDNIDINDDEICNNLILHYQKVLKDYYIEYDDELLDYLVYILNDAYINYIGVLGNCDVESMMSGRMIELGDYLLEIVYIRYLQLIDLKCTNKSYYFSNEEIPEDSIYYYFHQLDFDCPMDLIKEIAIKRNHVKEGGGIEILRYKSRIIDIKEVLGKYNLKKSGNKKELINRIENNLTKKEINKEFKGSIFVLTESGRKFLNEQRDFNIDYYEALPSCFLEPHFYILCKENPEYSIEDIIYSLVMHEWYDIENPKIFKKNSLDDFISEINNGKFVLAKLLDKEKHDKINELYFNIKTI